MSGYSFTRRTHRTTWSRNTPSGHFTSHYSSGSVPAHCYTSERTRPASPPDGELRVQDSNLHLSDNRREHHTDEYEKYALIVRRGAQFKLSLEFNRKLQKDQGDSFRLQLTIGPHPRKSKDTLVDVRETAQIKQGIWSYRVVNESGNKVTVSVFVPADAIVGNYNVAVNMYYRNAEKVEQVKRHQLKDHVIVLFNPWSEADQVYMPNEDERQEHVMNETGRVYVGTRRQIMGRPWNFGQFERCALDAALHLLDISYLATEGHGNPTRVCRALSALVNSVDDNGVLEGRWEGGYPKGRPPTAWNGSVAILDEYMLTRRPVKYGQCWVFSGVLTTVCRALGIPARSVTNFQSAHDSDCSMTIDEHRDTEGRPLSDYNEDVWNFHVWNEGWFKRPDLPEGNDGWQAFDATPQEASEGMYRCGPAPVAAIKEGNVFYGYDAPFIYAEVNGEYVVWMVDTDGNIRPITHIEKGVGYSISTKAVGAPVRQDITDTYKHPEGSNEERVATEKAWRYSSRRAGLSEMLATLTGQDCRFELDGAVHKNGDVCVKLHIHNDASSPRHIKVRMYANAKYYTGTAGEEIDDFDKVTVVGAKTDSTIEWDLKVVDFVNRLDEDAALGIYALAEVDETSQCFSAQDTFHVDKPDLDIKVLGQPKKGTPCQLEISFTNPLAVKLTNCRLTLEGAGLQQEITIPTKRILSPGERVVEHVSVTPRVAGKREVIANLHTRQVSSITGALEVTVKE